MTIEEKNIARKPPYGTVAGVVVGLAALCFGGNWLIWDRHLVKTNDAFIDGPQTLVMSRISEKVNAVLADVDQPVRKNQIIVQLDNENLNDKLLIAKLNLAMSVTELAEAEAVARIERQNGTAQEKIQSGNVNASRAATKLAGSRTDAASAAVIVARLEYEATKDQMLMARAALPASSDAVAKATNDFARLRSLHEQEYVSTSVLEAGRTTLSQAVAADAAAKIQVRSAQDMVEIAQAKLNQAIMSKRSALEDRNAFAALEPAAQARLEAERIPSRGDDKEAGIQKARRNIETADAALSLARNNFTDTKIVAPVDGWITSRNVEPGQTIAPGQALLVMTSADRVHVTANYKETQVARLRVGQDVDVHVDACGRGTHHGRISSIGAVSQGSLSTIPTLTAPTSFVKVTQRVPVRITLPKDLGSCVVRPGMSVEVAAHAD